MSDYRDGFQDGVTFAREVIVENIRQWAEDSEDSNIFDEIADRIETGKLQDEDEESDD